MEQLACGACSAPSRWLSGKLQISGVNLAAVVLLVESDEKAAGVDCADDAVPASCTWRPVDDAAPNVRLLGYYHWVSPVFWELVAPLKHNLNTIQVTVELGTLKGVIFAGRLGEHVASCFSDLSGTVLRSWASGQALIDKFDAAGISVSPHHTAKPSRFEAIQ